MKLDPQEQKKGLIWLFTAGPIAILLTFALYTVDQTLTQSTSEAELGNTLRELRGAQTTLKSSQTDPRQNVGHTEFKDSENSQIGHGLTAVTTAELDEHEAH